MVPTNHSHFYFQNMTFNWQPINIHSEGRCATRQSGGEASVDERVEWQGHHPMPGGDTAGVEE
jgi:hypothetical protein